MEITSQFFDGKVYTAESFAATNRGLLNTGVAPIPTSLSVIADHNMTITVTAGCGIIQGRTFQIDNDISLTVERADGSTNRVDRVIIRQDLTVDEEKFELVLIKGDYIRAIAPVRDGTYYELVLADILVNAGITEITQEVIIDQRTNSEVCGLMSTIANSMNITEFMQQQISIFNQWMEHLGNELDSNQAANLLLQIDRLRADVATFSGALDTVNQYDTVSEYLKLV